MTGRASAAALGLLCMFFENARPAHAQLGWIFHSLGEFDSNDVVFALAGLTVAPQRAGWTPTAVLHAYWLRFPAELADQSVIAAIPSLGLRHGFANGAISLRAGYTLTDSDIKTSPGITADVGAGVVNTLHMEYWGNGSFGAEGTASYHYESENVWARARLSRRVLGFNEVGQIRIGGEAGYINGNGVSSFQPGLLLAVHPTASVLLSLGAGRRINHGDQATYFRTELRVLPKQ